MALGTHDVQATGLEHLVMAFLPLISNCGLVSAFTSVGQVTLETATQYNIGTTTGHVGRDGDRTWPPRVLYDQGLPLMLLGVQNLMLDLLLAEEFG